MRQPPIDHWGVDADLVPLPGGCRNVAYRTRGLGRDLVFKSSRRSPAAVEWLLQVHAVARASGFVVPSLVRSLGGNIVECGWTCESFLEGRPLLPEEMPSVAPRIARFHLLAARVSQRPGFRSSQELLDQTTGGDVDLGAMPPALVETCRSAWRGVAGPSCTIVHGDLNPGNLLRCPDGQTALIDWDECRRDLALFDLGQLTPVGPSERRALLAWEVACSWRIEPDRARDLAQRL